MSNLSQRSLLVAAVMLLGTLSIAFYRHRVQRPRASEKEMVVAQDEVYEAVVRDMITSNDGRVRFTQLVFGDAVLTPVEYEGETDSCETRARKQMWLENSRLPYNTLADKAYRLFSRDGYADALRPDTIRDFVKKFCTPGQLSRTFHTELPRTFVGDERIDFGGSLIFGRKGAPPAKRFPGAGGRISFSRVGFDPHLDEAIVATSFVCGGLCGSGGQYVLRKRHGRWEVVNKWMVWVS